MELNKKILITAPVYQQTDIFKEYLNSLSHLNIPNGYEVHKYFYLCNSPELEQFLNPEEYEIDNYNFENKKEKGSHVWEEENYTSVRKARTKALEKARKENYDYVFSVDTDILLHPNCLKYLLEDNKDIVGMVYWHNSKDGGLGTNYYYADNWNTWPGVNDNFFEKGLYEVGIACASVLIGKRIINNEKIDYYTIDCVDFTQWEDYALSLKAHILIPDLQVFIDTRLPSRHLTERKDYIRWMKEKEEYNQYE